LNYLKERINIRLDELFEDSHFRIFISFSRNIISFTSNIRQTMKGLNYDPRIQFKDGCKYLFNIENNVDPFNRTSKKISNRSKV
jgi:hypothetical protein